MGTAALAMTLAVAGVCMGQSAAKTPTTTPTASAAANAGILPTPVKGATSLPLPASITPNGVVVEDVVARVNGQIITRSDVERAQAQMEHEIEADNVPADTAAERRKNLLRDLVDQQLLLSKGKEMDINADAQVITQLDEIRKQNHFATMEELQQAAQQSGVSFEDFKANIKNGIISQQVIREQVGRRLQLTHADVQKYYDEHKSDFTVAESVKLSEILIPTADNNDATVAAAKAKAEQVAAELKAGAKFEDVAKKESGGPTAADGGELGEFKRGALAKELEDKTFGQAAGTVTVPIRTRQGFVLLKVNAYTPAGAQPLADVEPQVEEAVYMKEMQPALRAYLTQLREESFVDIKPGFTDSGASAKQTKPIFTAYALPAKKGAATAATTEHEKTKREFDRHGYKTPAVKKQAEPPQTANIKTTKKGKNKVKREKVRYGQVPRETLPSVPTLAATETGSADASTSLMQQALPEPVDTNTPNPLEAKQRPKKKSRYAAHPVAVKPKKVKAKAVAAPAPTATESATEKVQSAPLGLAGDTAKKKPQQEKGSFFKPKKKRLESGSGAGATQQPTPSATGTNNKQ